MPTDPEADWEGSYPGRGWGWGLRNSGSGFRSDTDFLSSGSHQSEAREEPRTQDLRSPLGVSKSFLHLVSRPT